MNVPGLGSELPEIPFVDAGAEWSWRVAETLPQMMKDLVLAAEKLYSRPILRLIDAKSKNWLAKNSSPFAGEIERIAALVERPGVAALNVSYEWACTSGAQEQRLWRTLDWPFEGLGSGIVVARCKSASGDWLNITWPGFVGALTALKPGRFAAALNQAPLRRRTGLLPIDWAIDRIRVERNTDLPATHVLRQAFETCADFKSASRFLAETPMALPALFVLAGAHGEAAVIERQERTAIVHEGPGAIANQWISPSWHGRQRGGKSDERRKLMLDRIASASASHQGQGGDFGWLVPPILNRRTRLAAALEVATGRLAVMGLERLGDSAAPATKVLTLNGLEPGR